jgi:hypothetical protein
VSPESVILLVLPVAVAGAAGGFYLERQRSRQRILQLEAQVHQLVPRESTASQQHGTSLAAPLSADEQFRFTEVWRKAQNLFLDDPRRAVHCADALLSEVLAARGCLGSDFEERYARIEASYPDLTDSYKAAHQIAANDKGEGSSTEELRRAMIHYRTLLADLVGPRFTLPEAAARAPLPR